jgi:hypothetical protein
MRLISWTLRSGSEQILHPMITYIANSSQFFLLPSSNDGQRLLARPVTKLMTKFIG